MNHKYQDLMEAMHAPVEWNGRVIAAVREVPARKSKPHFWPAAACAVLAVVVVVAGVLTVNHTRVPGGTPEMEDPAPAMLSVSGAERGVNGAVFLSSLTVEETERLNGTTQTLTLSFADGTEETGAYSLRKEAVAAFYAEDGTQVMTPVLEGDPSETVTGLYAVPESESRWLLWPVEGADTVSLSNRYGYRIAPGGQGGIFHAGIDIPAEQGTPVVAAAAGTVKTAEFDPDRGNYLVIDHGDGMETVYAQCLSLSVKVGDAVTAGQEVATVGSTGKSTGPHLCFQVWQDGEAQNPVAYFEADIRDTLQMG